MNIRQVNLSHIRRDGGTQARADMNQSAIEDYAQAMEAGAKFPPVVLFQDQDTYWLGDGFHRVAAAIKAGKKGIQADIRQGGQRQARLFALGANSTHGVRRTNADKRLAVSILLDDPEWSRWSDRQIADAIGVSQPFVSAMRKERVITVITPEVATVASSSNHDAPTLEPVEPEPDPELVEEIPDPPIHGNDLVDALDDTACDVSKEPERQAALEAPPEPKPKADPPADVAVLKARVEELEELNAYLASELETARNILDAEDLLARFDAEVKKVQAMNTTLERRNFGLMDENNDLKGRLKSALRKIDRLEKAAKGAA
jgi:hypothetical protein